MRVLLDARAGVGGLARYVTVLWQRLEATLPAGSVAAYGAAARHWGRAAEPRPPAPWKRIVRPFAAAPLRILSDQVGLPVRAARWRADVFHATRGIVPAGLRVPAILTCADRWAITNPRERPWGLRTWYEQREAGAALHRAAHVIALSDTVARELATHANVDPSRITTVYPILADPVAADEGTPARRRLTEPFLLSVGTIEPRKNLERLIAGQVAAYRDTGVPLVIAGARGWRETGILRAAKAAGAAVRLPGYVTDAELAWLYEHAAAAVQFSRYEGFDYPVAEALRVGLPLVLSDIEVHREVAGDAARYVPVDDPAALASAMACELGRSDRDRARAAARARFARIEPRAAVARYLACYEGVL